MKKIFAVLFLLIAMNTYSQIYPPNGGNVCPGSLLLNWDDVPSAISYRVQVYQGATIILDVSGIPVSQYLIPAGILQSNTTYYWRIQVTGPGGPGIWSSAWFFSVLSIPNSPILFMPTNGETNVNINPAFTWIEVTGATFYIFQLSKSPLFDSLVINDTTPLPVITLQYNTQYYWRMLAGNTCGTSNWSAVWTFKTGLPIPSAPILICDTANVPLTPILDWYDVPNTLVYRIQVSISPAFTSTLINAVVIVSQYTVPSAILNYNSHYYWRTNATNASGSGPWSAICSFQTIIQSGIVKISSEIPTENKLYGNYPNPFNPVTKIRFDIPNSTPSATQNPIQRGTVVLKVYDIAGREVKTLVNEVFQPGSYEVTFDGSGLNSGVYFYQLVAGSYSETKKMILIK